MADSSEKVGGKKRFTAFRRQRSPGSGAGWRHTKGNEKPGKQSAAYSGYVFPETGKLRVFKGAWLAMSVHWPESNRLYIMQWMLSHTSRGGVV